MSDREIPLYPPEDDTKPPRHYQTQHEAEGIALGSEQIHWLVAMRGREFTINFLIGEIFTKANRMGQPHRRDKLLADCFKLRQACMAIVRLMEE